MKSKSLFFLLVFILTGLGAAKAQIPGLALGIRGGYAYSTMPSSITETIKGREGFQIGAFARIGGKTYLQPEINYEALGGHFYLNDGSQDRIRVDAKYDRLDIPVLVGHKFISLPLFGLRGYIGPNFGFKSSGKYKSSSYLLPSNYDFKSSTFGGVVGIGVDIAFLTIDGRYNLGFNEVNKGFESRVNSFTLGLGFKFL